MRDPLLDLRFRLQKSINENPLPKDKLERLYGKVWNTEELAKDFEVITFLAPFVVVTRRKDGAKGSLLFQHNPRLYFAFKEDTQ